MNGPLLHITVGTIIINVTAIRFGSGDLSTGDLASALACVAIGFVNFAWAAKALFRDSES